MDTMQKMAKEQLNPKLVQLIRERLGGYHEIKEIYIEYVNNEEVKVIVITENINPELERGLVQVENEVEEKYKIPSRFFTFSSASTVGSVISS